MTSQTVSQFARPRIDARALLGLYDPADTTDWAPIRAAQMHSGSQLALFMLAANVIGAALITLILAPLVPAWQLAGWALLATAVGLAVAFRRLSKRHRAASVATLADVRETVLDGISLGAVWSIPPLAFGNHADADAALGLWIILSLMMTASAVAMAALPLATIAFLTITGIALAIMVAFAAGPVLAGAVAFFTVLLIISTFGRGKALVVIRAGEIAIAERDETVSLLLRESNESEQADWLWEIDAQRRVNRANSRFALSLGADPKKINGTPFLQLLAGSSWETGKHATGLRNLSDKLRRREPFHGLLLSVRVHGGERWWEMSASPRFDDGGVFCGFRGVGSDVTEARASAAKINRMARFDTLTALPNRLMINETLVQAVVDADKTGSRCAFMMIDLDRFKAVNDTLGHPIGDKLLSCVSQRLKALTGPNEMAGRLGGDEFAVIVRDATDTARTEALAQTIIDTLSKPYEVDTNTLHIGCSIGLATGPRDGRSAEALIRAADLALYRSKDAGGGVYHAYAPELHVAAEERRVLEIALRSAVQNGEMHLAYQPVVATESGELTGFEALLRWTNPAHGVIPPAKFIPLAEEARLIAPIGEWVVRTACREAARWQLPVRVAVNVSPEQLHNPNFVRVVAEALADSGLSPDRLELEVTESVFMREGTAAIEVLEQILDLGVRLALDDFGTGFSSLGYLAHARFSSIKVDRSFVQGASRGVKESIAIIRAVVALAQSLGMGTTAEGVETRDQHRLVQQLGCTRVQGYFFGRPLPAEDARALTMPAATSTAAA